MMRVWRRVTTPSVPHLAAAWLVSAAVRRGQRCRFGPSLYVVRSISAGVFAVSSGRRKVISLRSAEF